MKSVLTAFASLCVLTAAAQDGDLIINHHNGKPALIGQCSFDFMRNEAYDLLHGPRGRLESYRDNPPIAETIADADGETQRRNETLNILIAMKLSCEGAVRAYYRDGSLRLKASYKAGELSGAYSEYYPGGKVALRCTLTNGMLSGDWTRFYKNGRPFASGRFLPYDGSLLDSWQGSVYEGSSRDFKGFSLRVMVRSNSTREQFRDIEGDEVSALGPWLEKFDPYLGKLPTNGRPHGPFTFKDRSGRVLAKMQFDSGLRAGIWTAYDKEGGLQTRLEYDGWGLTHVTSKTTPRKTLRAFVDVWRRDTAARADEARKRNEQKLTPPPSTSIPSSTPGVFTYVKQMPEFIGDVGAYLSANTRYPVKAKSDGIEGRVVVRFVVREDGSITDAKVLRGIGGGCDEEALRVIRAMPKWKPGRQNGKPVAVWFNLPMHFALE